MLLLWNPELCLIPCDNILESFHAKILLIHLIRQWLYVVDVIVVLKYNHVSFYTETTLFHFLLGNLWVSRCAHVSDSSEALFLSANFLWMLCLNCFLKHILWPQPLGRQSAEKKNKHETWNKLIQILVTECTIYCHAHFAVSRQRHTTVSDDKPCCLLLCLLCSNFREENYAFKNTKRKRKPYFQIYYDVVK